MNTNGFKRYFLTIPKAELHIHFEGAMQPETLLFLAHKNKIQLPFNTVDELRKWFIFNNFSHFITVYLTIINSLRTTEDYEYSTYRFGEFLSKQNIKYAEVTFTPGIHYRRGISFETYFTGLTKGRERVLKDFEVQINWIFDIERNSGEREKYANYVVDVATEGKKERIIAIGLGGKEEGFPARLFESYFTRARKVGFHSVPHAGEFTDSKNIWDSIELLGAERIGHGIKAADDERLMMLLSKRKIPLEVNPISNIKLGIYKIFQEHPIQLLHEKGIPLILGSDDPALFSNNLLDNFTLLIQKPYFSVNVINELIRNSVEYSFMSQRQKKGMLVKIESLTTPVRKFLDEQR